MQNVFNAISTALNDQGEQPARQMDPKLFYALLLARNGKRRQATSSTTDQEISVIAKVSDPASWTNLTEVRTPVKIATTADGLHIVTGRIPIKRIEFIRSLQYVKSLKAARRLSRVLDATIPDIGAGKFPPTATQLSNGKGVLVGIVDYGCDFAHPNFQKTGKKTRLVEFWDQTAKTTGPGVPYGQLYSAATLNKALGKSDPYSALGYRPEEQAHGTHVMDIATGNGSATGAAGVAPGADILFVQPSTSDIPMDGPESMEKNFGDSVHLIEAIRYIFDRAGEQPCVINISLGTNGGPHDGSTLVEQAIDGMLAEKPNRAICIAASNSYEDNIHSAGQVAPNGNAVLYWLVDGNDQTENEMEIWYKGTERLSVELIDPTGKNLGNLQPGETGTIKDDSGRIKAVITNRLDDPNNHDNVIGIWLNGNTAGKWSVRLSNPNVTAVLYHAWIERDDYGQSKFGGIPDNAFTLGSISCGRNTITVGAYDAHKSGSPIAYFSSEGPTRDGREKPEVSAPGMNVLAAGSETKTGRILMSGTSMAAPAVTGAIAVLLSEARKMSKSLTIEQIREILIKAARKSSPTASWDSRYGYGRLYLPDMLEQLTALTTKKPVRKAIKVVEKKSLKKVPRKAPKRAPRKLARKAPIRSIR